jgi:transmembrane sensor
LPIVLGTNGKIVDSRIIYLFLKYINDKCELVELEEVLAMIKNGEYLAEWDAAIAEDAEYIMSGNDQGDLNEDELNSIYAGIERDLVHSGGKEFFHAKRSIKLWPRITAIAASILLILSVSYLLIHKSQPSQQVAKTQVKQDLMPGSNKAILTLANGKQVVLTGANNGIIAKENQATINKTKDGQIVYDGTATTNEAVLFNTTATPRGGRFDLTLSDGPKVTLDAASSIRYPVAFNGSERKVEITGQVYFEVAHNKSKPFLVTTKGQTVEVLGTHFNINAYDDEPDLRTTLLEGSVRITKNNNTAILKPGEQSIVNDNTVTVKEADTEAAVAWKNGYFEFKKADIKTVMRQLSRWYDVDIAYEGNIPDRKFSGEIDRNTKASRALEGLSFTKIHFRIEGKKIIVTP